MIMNALKYIVGYVVFTAFGGFSEKFLNLCEKENIRLWNIENKDGVITACTTAREYKKLRKISKSSGMKIRHIKKCGLRFFITENRLRAGLCIGAVACTLILITLSQFAWRVEVIGNSELDDDIILAAFEEYGVKKGAKISELDLNTITEKVLTEVPDISWASVNKKGSLLCIEVREKRKIPELYDSLTPTNVIASEDGVILSSDVIRGTEEVKVGSAVRKGDLLISGIVTHRGGETEFLHADGRVRAKVTDDFSVSAAQLRLYTVSSYKKHFDLFFFGFVVPVGPCTFGDMVNKSSSYLQSGEAALPLGVIKTTSFSFSDGGTYNDLEGLICTFLCAEHINTLLGTAEVKESRYTYSENGEFSARVYSICEKDIASIQEIYTEKNSDK